MNENLNEANEPITNEPVNVKPNSNKKTGHHKASQTSKLVKFITTHHCITNPPYTNKEPNHIRNVSPSLRPESFCKVKLNCSTSHCINTVNFQGKFCKICRKQNDITADMVHDIINRSNIPLYNAELIRTVILPRYRPMKPFIPISQVSETVDQKRIRELEDKIKFLSDTNKSQVDINKHQLDTFNNLINMNIVGQSNNIDKV